MITFPLHIFLGQDPEEVESFFCLPPRVQTFVRCAVEMMNAGKKRSRAEELVEVVVDNPEEPFCVMGVFRVEFDGMAPQFHSVKLGGNGVTIVAVTEENGLLVVHPERPLQDDGLWGSLVEFPQGHVDSGESPIQAAARELRQETGFESTRLVELGKIRPTAYVLGQNHVILALGCRKVAEPEPEATERLGKLEELTPDEVRQLLMSGEPVDGFFGAAWAKYQAYLG